MNPSLMQMFCQMMVAIGLVIAALGGFGAYYFGDKVEKLKKTDTLVAVQNNIKVDSNKTMNIKNQTINNFHAKKEDSQKNNMDEKKNKSGTVNVTSYNQTGGITANTVINKLDIPEPEYLYGIVSANVKSGEHYNTIARLKIDSKVPVPFVEVRLTGKTIYEMNISPLSGATLVMEGHSGKRDWGMFKTILNAFGEYEIHISSKEVENFDSTSWQFVDKYKY